MGKLRNGLDVRTYEEVHCVPLDTPEPPFGDMDVRINALGNFTILRPEDQETSAVECEVGETTFKSEAVVSGLGSQMAQRERE